VPSPEQEKGKRAGEMGESRESRRKWRDVLPGNRLGTN